MLLMWSLRLSSALFKMIRVLVSCPFVVFWSSILRIPVCLCLVQASCTCEEVQPNWCVKRPSSLHSFTPATRPRTAYWSGSSNLSFSLHSLIFSLIAFGC